MDEEAQRQFVADMLAKGHSKDDIMTAMDRIAAESKPSGGGHGRGDELFQPDPSPADVITAGRPRPKVSDGPDPDVVALPELRRALAGTSAPGAAPADDRAEAGDFARFALGGLVGMGASQGARALGAGGRTAGIIGGAAGGAAPAALEPDAKAKDIVIATLMGGALGGAGAPRGKRDQAKSQAGRAANAVERVGGEVGITRPGKGGMFDEPGYRDLPDGDPGTMRMAEEARGKIVGDLAARDASNRDGLDSAEGGVEAALGPRKLDVEPIRQQIDRLRAENSNTPAGMPVDPALDKRLAQIDSLLDPRIPEAPGATFGQLRGLQKSLNAEAQPGQPGTAENRPARMVQGTVRDAVKNAHPDMGPALERYGGEAQKLEDARNALYGGEGAIRDDDLMSLRNDETARSRLARYGKEGIAASNTGTTLDQLAEQSPLYREQLDRLGARNAEDVLKLQLSMPGGAGIAQGVARTIGHNIGAAGERFFRPATGIGYSGAGPGAAQLQLDPLIQLLLDEEDRR